MTDSRKFSLSIVMESDWHVGSGEGRAGAIDRLIDRDREELPFIPASTIRGMWRDAGERLAAGLDEGRGHVWAQFVTTVFGDQPALYRSRDAEDNTARPGAPAPTPSALDVSDARLEADLRAAMRGRDSGHRRLRDALVFVKPGVAIDSESGRAKPDFLRFEEMARSGMELSATGSVAEGEGARTAAAFLIASAALVDRLGGKRRRGAGRCRFEVTFDGDPEFGGEWSQAVDAACTVLEEEEADYKPVHGNYQSDHNFAYTAPLKDGWTEISYRLTVETPVCVPSDIQGNIVTTLDFIPGTYLLPWVSRAMGAATSEASAAIAAGDIRVLPAFPVPSETRSDTDIDPVYAIPRSFTRKKRKPFADWVNTTTADGRRMLDESVTQYKPVRDGFVQLGAVGAEPVRSYISDPDKVSRTHNTVDDTVQRPTSNVGGVYSYEALAPGTVLAGTIRIRSSLADGAAATLAAALDDDCLRLGRAGKAGYGRVAVELGETESEIAENHPREGEAGKDQVDGHQLVVWCLSDLLLPAVTEEGASTTTAVAIEIARVLGKRPETLFTWTKDDGSHLPATGTGDELLPRAFVDLRRYESWQNAWQLPRPTLTAIAAGSVFVLPLAKEVSRQDRDAIASEGLGIRKAEGFGAIAVDPHLLQKPEIGQPRGERPSDDAALQLTGAWEAKATAAQKRLVELVERDAWRKAIADAAETFAADDKRRRDCLGWTAKKPTTSQLGALRSAMGAFNSEPDEQRLRAFVFATHLKGDTRKKAIRRREDKFGGAGLDSLRELISEEPGNPKPSKVWHDLRLVSGAADTPAPLRRDANAVFGDEGTWRYAVFAMLRAAMLYEKREREGADLKDTGSASHDEENV